MSTDFRRARALRDAASGADPEAAGRAHREAMRSGDRGAIFARDLARVRTLAEMAARGDRQLEWVSGQRNWGDTGMQGANSRRSLERRIEHELRLAFAPATAVPEPTSALGGVRDGRYDDDLGRRRWCQTVMVFERDDGLDPSTPYLPPETYEEAAQHMSGQIWAGWRSRLAMFLPTVRVWACLQTGRELTRCRRILCRACRPHGKCTCWRGQGVDPTAERPEVGWARGLPPDPEAA